MVGLRMEEELGRVQKEVVMAKVKPLSQHSPEGNE